MSDTYRVVWRAFLGGTETLAEGLTLEEAEEEIRSLPPLMSFNGMAISGSYGLEVEEPHPAGNAPSLATE